MGSVPAAGGGERPGFLQIEIPKDLASLDELYEAPPHENARLVLHIQDLHGSYQAQLKIKDLLQYLHQKYSFKLLFLEGATDEVHPEFLQLLPDGEANRQVLHNLAQDGEVTGSELFLMGKPENVTAVGIERADLYRKNFDAFKSVHKNSGASESFLRLSGQRLDALSSRFLSRDMRRVLQEWARFHDGRREFLPYIKQLAADARQFLGIDLESLFAQVEWPQTTRLLVLQSMEKDLNPPQAAKEKELLAAFLKKNGLPASLIDAINELGESKIVVSRIRDEDEKLRHLPRFLLERLVEQAGPKGFYFHDYPAFSLYAGYQILQSELDSRALFEEIEGLFSKVLEQLAAGERERNLLELFRDQELLEKLARLELTRDDWERALYRREWIEPKTLVKRIQTLQESEFGRIDLEAGLDEMGRIFEDAFAFYRYAREREAVFYQTIDKEMKDRKTEKAVLITGGFHTDGLMDIFREKEVNYGVLMPRLNGQISNESYLATMMQEKSTAFDVATLVHQLRLLNDAGRLKEMGADLGALREELLNESVQAWSKLYAKTPMNQAVPRFMLEVNAFNTQPVWSKGNLDVRLIAPDSTTGGQVMILIEDKPIAGRNGNPLVLELYRVDSQSSGLRIAEAGTALVRAQAKSGDAGFADPDNQSLMDITPELLSRTGQPFSAGPITFENVPAEPGTIADETARSARDMLEYAQLVDGRAGSGAQEQEKVGQRQEVRFLQGLLRAVRTPFMSKEDELREHVSDEIRRAMLGVKRAYGDLPEYQEKGNKTVVTLADYLVQILVIVKISELFPEDFFLGEEKVDLDYVENELRKLRDEKNRGELIELYAPALTKFRQLQAMHEPREGAQRTAAEWTIQDLDGKTALGLDPGRFIVTDPVDGTSNFQKGSLMYGFSLARTVYDAQLGGHYPEYSVTYAPEYKDASYKGRKLTGPMLEFSRQDNTVKLYQTTGWFQPLSVVDKRVQVGDGDRRDDRVVLRDSKSEGPNPLLGIFHNLYPGDYVTIDQWDSSVVGLMEAVLGTVAVYGGIMQIWDHAGTLGAIHAMGGKVFRMDKYGFGQELRAYSNADLEHGRKDEKFPVVVAFGERNIQRIENALRYVREYAYAGGDSNKKVKDKSNTVIVTVPRADADPQISLWDGKTKELLRRVSYANALSDGEEVRRIQSSANGRHVFISGDRGVAVWDLTAYETDGFHPVVGDHQGNVQAAIDEYLSRQNDQVTNTQMAEQFEADRAKRHNEARRKGIREMIAHTIGLLVNLATTPMDVLSRVANPGGLLFGPAIFETFMHGGALLVGLLTRPLAIWQRFDNLLVAAGSSRGDQLPSVEGVSEPTIGGTAGPQDQGTDDLERAYLPAISRIGQGAAAILAVVGLPSVLIGGALWLTSLFTAGFIAPVVATVSFVAFLGGIAALFFSLALSTDPMVERYNDMLAQRERGQAGRDRSAAKSLSVEASRTFQTHGPSDQTQNGALAYAPDGQSIAVLDDYNIYLINREKSGITNIPLNAMNPPIQTVSKLAYSPDGKAIAVSSAYGVMEFDVATGRVQRSYTTHRAGNTNANGALAYSPDGRTIALLDGYNIYLIDRENAGTKNISLSAMNPPIQTVSKLAYSPDGKAIAVSSAYGVMEFDVATGRVQKSYTTHRAGNTNANGALAYAPDGQTIAVLDGYAVHLIDRQSQEIQTASLDYAYRPFGARSYLAYSPDGTTLAVSVEKGVWEYPVSAVRAQAKSRDDIQVPYMHTGSRERFQEIYDAALAAMGRAGQAPSGVDIKRGDELDWIDLSEPDAFSQAYDGGTEFIFYFRTEIRGGDIQIPQTVSLAGQDSEITRANVARSAEVLKQTIDLADKFADWENAFELRYDPGNPPSDNDRAIDAALLRNHRIFKEGKYLAYFVKEGFRADQEGPVRVYPSGNYDKGPRILKFVRVVDGIHRTVEVKISVSRMVIDRKAGRATRVSLRNVTIKSYNNKLDDVFEALTQTYGIAGRRQQGVEPLFPGLPPNGRLKVRTLAFSKTARVHLIETDEETPRRRLLIQSADGINPLAVREDMTPEEIEKVQNRIQAIKKYAADKGIDLKGILDRDGIYIEPQGRTYNYQRIGGTQKLKRTSWVSQLLDVPPSEEPPLPAVVKEALQADLTTGVDAEPTDRAVVDQDVPQPEVAADEPGTTDVDPPAGEITPEEFLANFPDGNAGEAVSPERGFAIWALQNLEYDRIPAEIERLEGVERGLIETGAESNGRVQELLETRADLALLKNRLDAEKPVVTPQTEATAGTSAPDAGGETPSESRADLERWIASLESAQSINELRQAGGDFTRLDRYLRDAIYRIGQEDAAAALPFLRGAMNLFTERVLENRRNRAAQSAIASVLGEIDLRVNPIVPLDRAARPASESRSEQRSEIIPGVGRVSSNVITPDFLEQLGVERADTYGFGGRFRLGTDLTAGLNNFDDSILGPVRLVAATITRGLVGTDAEAAAVQAQVRDLNELLAAAAIPQGVRALQNVVASFQNLKTTNKIGGMAVATFGEKPEDVFERIGARAVLAEDQAFTVVVIDSAIKDRPKAETRQRELEQILDKDVRQWKTLSGREIGNRISVLVPPENLVGQMIRQVARHQWQVLKQLNPARFESVSYEAFNETFQVFTLGNRDQINEYLRDNLDARILGLDPAEVGDGQFVPTTDAALDVSVGLIGAEEIGEQEQKYLDQNRRRNIRMFVPAALQSIAGISSEITALIVAARSA